MVELNVSYMETQHSAWHTASTQEMLERRKTAMPGTCCPDFFHFNLEHILLMALVW